MLCRKPFRQGAEEYGCGQCLPCRLNRRRLWTHRLLLEAFFHEFNSFWTLTYSDDLVPSDGSLRPRDYVLWLKRLRFALGPARPVRFFLCGEYGDETWRPHYHCVLYGVSSAEVELVTSTWGMGFCYPGELTRESAQYVCGYVVKKMTSADDPRLLGRHPEFTRMSRRPYGIGAQAVPQIMEALNDSQGAALTAREGDVPRSLMHSKTSLPLGRYLRRLMREYAGFENTGGQESAKFRQAQEVRALLEVAGSVKAFLSDKEVTEQQKMLRMEKKSLIYSKKGSL